MNVIQCSKEGNTGALFSGEAFDEKALSLCALTKASGHKLHRRLPVRRHPSIQGATDGYAGSE